MTASVLKQKFKHTNGEKERLFNMTQHKHKADSPLWRYTGRGILRLQICNKSCISKNEKQFYPGTIFPAK